MWILGFKGLSNGDVKENGKNNIFKLVKEQLSMSITLFCHFTCLYRHSHVFIDIAQFHISRFIALGIQVLSNVSAAVGRRRNCLSCTIP